MTRWTWKIIWNSVRLSLVQRSDRILSPKLAEMSFYNIILTVLQVFCETTNVIESYLPSRERSHIPPNGKFGKSSSWKVPWWDGMLVPMGDSTHLIFNKIMTFSPHREVTNLLKKISSAGAELVSFDEFLGKKFGTFSPLGIQTPPEVRYFGPPKHA